MNHLKLADSFTVNRTTGSVSADDFDALILPGGVANPDSSAPMRTLSRW